MADFRDLDLRSLSLELDKFKYFIGGPGGPSITLKATTGAPATTEPKGSLCINTFDSKLYITSGGGTWGIVTSA